MPNRQGQQICHYISFLIHENQTLFHSLSPTLVYTIHKETCRTTGIYCIWNTWNMYTHTLQRAFIYCIHFPSRSNCMHPWGREGLLEKSTAGSLKSSVSLLEWQTIDCILCVCFIHLHTVCLHFFLCLSYSWQFFQMLFQLDLTQSLCIFPL